MTRRRGRALVWFRRDLRDYDHAALHRALAAARDVFCAFVFDTEILDRLPSRRDRRVEFIHGSVCALDAALRRRGGALVVRHGRARDEIARLAAALGVERVFANRDYEPSTRERDAAVERALAAQGIGWETCKDQLIFDTDEVLAQSGAPFRVFTPYRAAWLRRLAPRDVEPYATSGALAPLPAGVEGGVPGLAALGFEQTNLAALGVVSGMRGGAARFAEFRDRIDRYREKRDYPGVKGPSYLSVHLRFGTVSVRELVRFAHARSFLPGGDGAAAWLSELIWREFYAQILWHFPHVADRAFKAEFERLRFIDDPVRLAAWQDGRTGYPIVDAGMRQLATTGYMHNRLRMIAASFLVKDLLIDWRLGERHFADALLDYDLASNNGGWQWAASTGCDAQPYFRIFNPVTQSRRFDPDGAFIRRYVPEIAALDDEAIHAPWLASAAVQRSRKVIVGRDYPAPIVDHASARARALALFKAAAA